MPAIDEFRRFVQELGAPPAARRCAAWLSRPRARLAVLGVVLLACGAVFLAGSIWTLPLLIVGGVMVVIAWAGARLEGRLTLSFGDGATEIVCRAAIRPLAPSAPARNELSAVPAASPGPGPTATGPGPGPTATSPGPVERDLAELEALIASAAHISKASQPA